MPRPGAFLTHRPLQQDRPPSLRGSHHSPWPPGSPSPSTVFITDFQPASGPSGPRPHPHLLLWGTVPPRDLRASCRPGSVQTRVHTMSWERPGCMISARLAAGFGECPHHPLTANSGSLFLTFLFKHCLVLTSALLLGWNLGLRQGEGACGTAPGTSPVVTRVARGGSTSANSPGR